MVLRSDDVALLSLPLRQQSLTEEEQKLFRLYGKLPDKKNLLGNKLKVSSSQHRVRPSFPFSSISPSPFPSHLRTGTKILRLRRLRPLQSRQSPSTIRWNSHPQPRNHSSRQFRLLPRWARSEWWCSRRISYWRDWCRRWIWLRQWTWTWTWSS